MGSEIIQSVAYHNYDDFRHVNSIFTQNFIPLEISVKSGKDRVSTPSLVIHRVRFKKETPKKYISIPEFHPVFLLILSASTAATLDFHCSSLYSYYNSSRTLCIKC